jgi:hypothetical protein
LTTSEITKDPNYQIMLSLEQKACHVFIDELTPHPRRRNPYMDAIPLVKITSEVANHAQQTLLEWRRNVNNDFDSGAG